MAELLVALTIFSIISTLGVGGFSFMLKNQIKHRLFIEDQLIREIKVYNCKKELAYLTFYKSSLKPPSIVTCSDLQKGCQKMSEVGC